MADPSWAVVVVVVGPHPATVGHHSSFVLQRVVAVPGKRRLPLKRFCEVSWDTRGRFTSVAAPSSSYIRYHCHAFILHVLMVGRGGGVAPAREGPVRYDAVAVRGVRGVLRVVVGQLGRVRHRDGHRHVHLAYQKGFTVDVVAQGIVGRVVGDHLVMAPTTGQAFHFQRKGGSNVG